MKNEGQSGRLTNQQKVSHGVSGILNDETKFHDTKVSNISKSVQALLEKDFPTLIFRYRKSILKQEINAALQKADKALGQTLFVDKAEIKPDGGILEVKDDNDQWRVILVSEAKYQGKDIENIRTGKQVGIKNDQDLMTAGNAIERAYKNISEMANYMLSENYFPYVLFLEGSNFLTKDITVIRPDGREVTLKYRSGALNRLDRLTASNYGMSINQNLCINKHILLNGNYVMLQATSIYTKGNGDRWGRTEMTEIMLDIAKTSLKMLGKDLFTQLTSNKEISR
ncbi:MAG: hypothetical protein IJI41_02945 [Anaerolineaceae bacterium]|nr:hypothetical protein [Anaerolineaceae bacterium]